jgi:hypothetical protein
MMGINQAGLTECIQRVLASLNETQQLRVLQVYTPTNGRVSHCDNKIHD